MQQFQNQSMENLVEQMQNREIDILIGTQILAKGYHFPKLSLRLPGEFFLLAGC